MTQAIAVPATAASGLLTSRPGTLYGWVFREASGAGGGGAVDGAEVAIVAAAAANVSLPHATDLITGFTVTMAAVAAAAGGTVTVSNVVSGPYVYNFEALVGQAAVLTVTFPQPVPSTGVAPNVAISAIVGGGAGQISVYGLTTIAPAAARLHDGLAANGRLLAVIDLAGGGETDGVTGADGVDITAGMFLEVLAGTVEGVVYADLE